MWVPFFSLFLHNQSKSEATTSANELGQEHIAMATKKMSYKYKL